MVMQPQGLYIVAILIMGVLKMVDPQIVQVIRATELCHSWNYHGDVGIYHKKPCLEVQGARHSSHIHRAYSHHEAQPRDQWSDSKGKSMENQL